MTSTGAYIEEIYRVGRAFIESVIELVTEPCTGLFTRYSASAAPFARPVTEPATAPEYPQLLAGNP